MGGCVFYKRKIVCYIFPVFVALLVTATGCHTSRHVPQDQYLLWKNSVSLKSDKVMTNRGEVKDNLERLIVQKANSNYMDLPLHIPKRLWWYNVRYEKMHDRPDSLLPKAVERPVIYDSATLDRSAQNMKNYLFNQGYFYATVQDTVIYKKKKAYIKYSVNAGANFIINRINYDITDSTIAKIIKAHANSTVLQKGKEFVYSLLEEERSRLATIVENYGYRRFALDNISFKIDTMDKSYFKVASSPFENAVNFISQAKSNRKGTIDIDIIVRLSDDTLAYHKYSMSKVIVYPDYRGLEDRTDSTMKVRIVNKTEFRYHDEYVRPKVLYEHIFLNTPNPYSKLNENKTITKLGELGIFQSTRVRYDENRVTRDSVVCSIMMARAKKLDFVVNYEVSRGSTYDLGNSLSLNYRNKNFLRGANLLSIGVNGGVETYYSDTIAQKVFDRFRILTLYYGLNASIDFPKFLAPFRSYLFNTSNLPHTIINTGINTIERINYFKLVNISANFAYNWHETQIKAWSFSPAFMNIIRLTPTDSFKKVLEANTYLRNSYRQTFIEGENIVFKLDDQLQRQGKNYSYVRLAFEEAGGILKASFRTIYRLDNNFEKQYNEQFSQYTKFDFDAHHYFTFQRSVIALRLYGGVGIPYGNSPTLPYIKQYFVGGPYSLRGWRIRSLGPGSSKVIQTGQIDRTGDIKGEFNGEYRFPIAPLFAGALKMNGAVFTDAGNIWLAHKDTTYVGGEFAFDKLGQDVAMDVGVGTRFDIASFLTFRIDVAMPVKKPDVPVNNGWVMKDIDFGNTDWRKNNIVVNFSIGYPF